MILLLTWRMLNDISNTIYKVVDYTSDKSGTNVIYYQIYFNVLSKNDFNLSFTSAYSRDINFEKIFDGLQKDSRIVILVDIPEALIPENMKLDKLEINDAQFKI